MTVNVAVDARYYRLSLVLPTPDPQVELIQEYLLQAEDRLTALIKTRELLDGLGQPGAFYVLTQTERESFTKPPR